MNCYSMISSQIYGIFDLLPSKRSSFFVKNHVFVLFNKLYVRFFMVFP